MADEAPEPIRNIGKVRKFVVGSDFEAYAEQLEFFFVANSVTDAKQKKAVLLTNMPAETYQLTKDLFAPHLLKEGTITYEAIVERLQKQLKPQKSALVARYEFDNRARNAGETVSEYVAVLKHLATECKFNETMRLERLRDRLVSGIRDRKMMSELLKLKLEELTFDTAVAKCIAIEQSCKDVETMQGGRDSNHTNKESDSVNLLNKPEEQNRNTKAKKGRDASPSPADPKCYRCHGDHQHKSCPFKNAICHYCKKSGHIRRACRKRSKETHSFKPPVNHIDDDDDSDSDDYLTRQLDIQVIESPGPALFGRDWLSVIKLDWGEIKALKVNQATDNETQGKVNNLLKKYKSVFDDDLGTLKGHQGDLKLKENCRPRYCKARQVPYALRPKVEAELTRLEKEGILNKVEHSEWATPIVPVVKRNGSVRICGDFKVSVNPVLIAEQYPLPRIEDIFANLAGAQQFGKRAMDQLLQGIPGTQCILDDMIITGKSNEEHLERLEEVLKRLQEAGLRANKEKCEFFKEKVVFCGHEIDANGLHKTQEMIEAVVNAPRPENVSQVRSFLGLVNYYNRFLPNAASVLHPLHVLLQKSHKWKWTEQCEKAFKNAKHLITSDLVLTHYDTTLPVKIACDASPTGIGAVLSHVMADGSERPVAFASRSLTKTERKYSQIDKEALSIVWGVKKFHIYLYGRRITLVTDHKPLTSIFHPEKGIPIMTATRLQRYALFLAGFEYDIEYKNTKEHCNADGLSRLPLPTTANDGERGYSCGCS
ncbi:Hypothetical predicted protein [Paramuricea clavata]|uniref:Uncharacterized protein n=1 Tax=Paramuricea clavata TaxID=317549 RepID=A0A6S7IKJ2_PARCT|nr:Hypothetical predicted protein [Paramuricea clavata]